MEGYGYAITNPEGNIIVNTVKWGKSYCISCFIDDDPYNVDWKMARERGFRCIKILVTPNIK